MPETGPLDVEYVAEAVAANELAMGAAQPAFEAELGALTGTQCQLTSSGTAAIHLALRALGVGRSDRVYCPTLTFVGTANPVLYLGATPVFLDSEEASWNLDPNVLERALRRDSERGTLPAAVIVVHLFGQSAAMREIVGLCETHGVPLIEDAAEALGTQYEGRQVGGLGRIGVFSFNGNKIITTGGGGALLSSDHTLLKHTRYLATQARLPSASYEHSELGYNYRLSNLSAALGRAQLRTLPQRVARRRANAAFYRKRFHEIEGFEPMPTAPWGEHTHWLSVFQLDEDQLGVSRDDLVRDLDQSGIEARPVWKPMHMQPLFEGAETVGGAVSERIYARGICLPSSSSLTDSDLGRVGDAVVTCLQRS